MPLYIVSGWHTARQHCEWTVEASSQREAARKVRELSDDVGLLDVLNTSEHGPNHVVAVYPAPIEEDE